MQVDLRFPADYKIEVLEELPQPETARHVYYPGASTIGGRDGVMVRVEPNEDEPWIGTFAFGTLRSRGLSGVFSTPDPGRICVVARGSGVLVHASNPLQSTKVSCVPIMDVRLVPQRGVIVFAGLTYLIAYDASGIRWRTKHLTWDDLKITNITGDAIRGEFYDLRTEQMSSFVVDLATGTHEGGLP